MRSRKLAVIPLEKRLMLAGDMGAPLPDFELIDVNESSSTYDQSVSPRDLLGQVTGWYFGYAT